MTTSPEEVLGLLKNGRGERVEWFADPQNTESVAAAMAAMANSIGGTILMGIDDTSGSVQGVRNASETVDLLLKAALAIDPPLIAPLPQVVRVHSRPVVALTIPRGMPHIYGLEGRFWQRRGAENILLKSRELHRLIVGRGEAHFETETSRAALSDLDWEKVRAYAASLSGMGDITPEQLLVKRGCLTEQEGQLIPTHAGILLFGKDPQRFVRGAEITAVRFAGDAMSDTFHRQDISGTLPDQIKRAEMFLADYLRKGVQLGATMARAEAYEYPMEAARELVVNAVAHRDYQINGDGIRLFIFSNRMEVTSPGRLPGPVTIDNIKDERFSRNPAIVQVLSDMGFIERLGYGVDRVIDLMRQQKLREPNFEETSGGFRVVLRNESTEPTAAEAAAKPLAFNGRYKGLEINPRQEAALLHLHHDEGNYRITNSDLQALCPDVHPETIRRDLADLVSKSILKKMGQKRGSYYILHNEQHEQDERGVPGMA
jgi:ATP-dependent DNA helicase RecG